MEENKKVKMHYDKLNESEIENVSGGSFKDDDGNIIIDTVMMCKCGNYCVWRGNYFNPQRKFDCTECGGKGTFIGVYQY